MERAGTGQCTQRDPLLAGLPKLPARICCGPARKHQGPTAQEGSWPSAWTSAPHPHLPSSAAVGSHSRGGVLSHPPRGDKQTRAHRPLATVPYAPGDGQHVCHGRDSEGWGQKRMFSQALTCSKKEPSDTTSIEPPCRLYTARHSGTKREAAAIVKTEHYNCRRTCPPRASCVPDVPHFGGISLKWPP